MMVGHLNYNNNVFMTKMKFLTIFFSQNVDITTATIKAHVVMYKQLIMQSYLWAYIDTFRFYAVAGVVIIPLLFFMKSKVDNGND